MKSHIKNANRQPIPPVKNVIVKWREDTPAELYDGVAEVQTLDGNFVLVLLDGRSIILSSYSVKWVRIEDAPIHSAPQDDEHEEVGEEAAELSQEREGENGE